jgi:hypothetical protein
MEYAFLGKHGRLAEAKEITSTLSIYSHELILAKFPISARDRKAWSVFTRTNFLLR